MPFNAFFTKQKEEITNKRLTAFPDSILPVKA